MRFRVNKDCKIPRPVAEDAADPGDFVWQVRLLLARQNMTQAQAAAKLELPLTTFLAILDPKNPPPLVVRTGVIFGLQITKRSDLCTPQSYQLKVTTPTGEVFYTTEGLTHILRKHFPESYETAKAALYNRGYHKGWRCEKIKLVSAGDVITNV